MIFFVDHFQIYFISTLLMPQLYLFIQHMYEILLVVFLYKCLFKVVFHKYEIASINKPISNISHLNTLKASKSSKLNVTQLLSISDLLMLTF